MNIWNIHATTPTALLLWRTDESRFRVAQQGQLATLLTNSDYILIDKKYKNLLDRLSNQLTHRPVTVVDQVRQLTWDNFIEIEILNEIQYGQTDKVDSSGLKIWKCSNDYVFISTDLKREFEQQCGNEFGFTIGFSYFAGTQTNNR